MRIAIGTAGWGDLSQSRIDYLLDTALSCSITLIDTAPAYGCEEIIANYPKKYQLNIATKLPHLKHKDSVEEAVRKLGVYQIKYLQLHQTDTITRRPEFWDQIQKLKDSGVFKSFGLSVYDNLPVHLFVDFYQVPMSIFDRRYQNYNLKPLWARSVLMRGVLCKPIDRVPLGLQSYRRKLDKFANKHAVSVQRLAIGYILAQKNVEVVIIGCQNASEIMYAASCKPLPTYLCKELEEYIGLVPPALVDMRRIV